MRRVPRRWSAVLAATTTALIWAPSAVALTPPVVVSGASPFATCTVGATTGSIVYPNAEVEPSIAVNPTNPDNLIAVYQQDRWSDGGAHGLVTAVTHDGGATWTSTWPHFSTCAGGTPANGGAYDRATDPWVTFGPTGVAFQIALSFSADSSTSAVLVSRSADGGTTWNEPTTLIANSNQYGLLFNDKESITADPTDPNYAYAVWDRGGFTQEKANPHSYGNFGYRQEILFSRTTDGGQTWEPATSILRGKPNVVTLGNQIVVLPDGTLIDGFWRGQAAGLQPQNYSYAIIRSTDRGVTWSQQFDIAQDFSVPVVDPDTGDPVRTGDGIPDFAVDRTTGTLYAVWMDARFNGGAHDDIVMATSVDSGRHWSAPVRINAGSGSAAAFAPKIQVGADGTIGVTFLDFRNHVSAGSTLQTDAWFISSSDGGATWSEQRLTPTSFDMRTAPVSEGRGYFIGDYMGLAVSGTTFYPLFVETTGGSANPTDVYFTEVGP